jgi:hypothetical protein
MIIKIQEIQSQIFRKAKNLEKIIFHNNKLKKLPENLFHKAESIKLITFNDNQIEELEQNLFHGLVNLKSIYFIGNQIKEIDSNTFIDLNNLQYIDFGNNQIDKRFYVAAGSYKDKMNLLAPFVFNNNQAPWEINKDNTDDLIKFVFEAISNDDTSKSLALFFRAFLTAGITDNNSAQLNAFKYSGRGENFYIYQGFDRTISFSFRVAAGSRDEIRPLYNKVNALMSQVYPDYSPQQGIMRAPVVRITIGDYLYRVPGFSNVP